MTVSIFFPLNCYDGSGGTQQSLNLLLEHLGNDYDCTVILPEGVKPFFSTSRRVSVRHTAGLQKWSFSFHHPVAFLNTFFKLSSCLSTLGGDYKILVVNDPITAIVAGLCQRHFDRIVYFSRASFYKKSIGLSLRFCAQGFSSYIGVSDDQCRLLRDVVKVPPSNVVTVPDPIQLPSNLHVKKLDPSCVVLGIVGQVDTNKNQLLFVTIISLLRSKGIKAVGEIWGPTPFPHYTDCVATSIKDHHLEDVIQFKGVAQVQVDIYQHLDVVVSTSASEGFGRTLVEGMSFGKIVVANMNAGGPSSIIHDDVNGLLFDPENAELLVNRLQRLFCNQNLYKKMQQDALDRSRTFSADRICATLESIIVGPPNPHSH